MSVVLHCKLKTVKVWTIWVPVECRDQACSQVQLRDQNDGFYYELHEVNYIQELLLCTVIYYEVHET